MEALCGANGARRTTGAAPAAKGRGKGRWCRHRGDGSGSDGTVYERHCGLVVTVVEKIDQLGQKTPASDGAGMINDFRLWGSLWCRQMGVPLSEEGGDIEG